MVKFHIVWSVLSLCTIFSNWTPYTDNSLYTSIKHVKGAMLKSDNVKHVLLYLKYKSFYLKGFITRNFSSFQTVKGIIGLIHCCFNLKLKFRMDIFWKFQVDSRLKVNATYLEVNLQDICYKDLILDGCNKHVYQSFYHYNEMLYVKLNLTHTKSSDYFCMYGKRSIFHIISTQNWLYTMTFEYSESGIPRYEPLLRLCNCYTKVPKQQSFDRVPMDFVTSGSSVWIIVFGYHPYNKGMKLELQVSVTPCRGIFPCEGELQARDFKKYKASNWIFPSYILFCSFEQVTR